MKVNVSKYIIVDKVKNLFLADVYCVGHDQNGQVVKFTFANKIEKARMGTKKEMLKFLGSKYIDKSTILINPNDLEIREVKISYEY